jgi:four helix bundle protein
MTNEEFNEIFRKRTMEFAVRTIKYIESVPFNSATRVLSFQLGKSGTSVGTNFRAFCRGRSKNEKFSKICVVVEEADESEYWLDIFSYTEYGNHQELTWLLSEIKEIIKITSKIKNKLYP